MLFLLILLSKADVLSRLVYQSFLNYCCTYDGIFVKKISLITSKYKSFTIERYKEDLLLQLPNKDFNTNTLEKVLTTFVNFFNQYAPCKNKTWRANHSSLTNKKLCKALITRTKLKNKCLRNRRLYAGEQIII